MKLWEKGFKTDQMVEQFTVGNDREFDLVLAKYDVLGNLAHAKMLAKVGLLTAEELGQLENALHQIEQDIEQGTFVIEEQFEDVHSKIEYELTQKVGEAGKKIHTARSRNDQVLVDLHLYFKDEITEIKTLVKTLFETLLTLSDQHKGILLPGYTHLQIAMPSSFGLWFSSYAECLVDDLLFLNTAYQISDQNPLGSAAGYGSSFPIDRELTTELLGFSTMKYNVIAAQMSRGKLEKSLAFALASVAGTLSKLSVDVCLYVSQNFGFIKFPKELTTGSSIMPHKQNPDVFELIRAKCNKIQALPTELTLLTNNLPSGYHRDFQLLKESTFPAIETTKECLAVANFMLQQVEVNEAILAPELYDNLFSVEAVNKLVIAGTPFREAYQIVGKQIAAGELVVDKNLDHTHEGSIGNLCLEEIRGKFEMVINGNK